VLLIVNVGTCQGGDLLVWQVPYSPTSGKSDWLSPIAAINRGLHLRSKMHHRHHKKSRFGFNFIKSILNILGFSCLVVS
ncbi:unnamed protein product, partial [Musa textilis]